MELYIISIMATLAVIAAGISLYGLFEARRRFDEMKIQYAISSQQEVELQGRVYNLGHEGQKLRDRAIEAETNFSNLKEQYAKIEGEKIEALLAKEQTEKKYYEATTQIQLANQLVSESEKHIQNLEKQRLQAFKDAKEALFKTGKEVFNKEAIELNKKALKESEEISKKTKEHFDTIMQRVNMLSGNVDTTSKDIKLVMKSMSSPTAVGQFSEVGLSNILKEYGLVEGQDFHIQYSIGAGDGAKRPDAVLFIRDNVFIIDSKASKFFLEFAELEGTPREQEALENIKRSMNKHLTDLASKGYLEAVTDKIRKTLGDAELGHVQTVMFLCNEAHVNKIAQADPEFISKAIAKNIVISGPTGLQGLLAFARYSIERQKRDKHRELLINEIRNLLGSISTVVGHASKVGNAIKASAKHYENLLSSVNSNLLSKAEKITKLGISPPSNKPLPAKLESFEIITHSQQLIESEAVNEDVDAENTSGLVIEFAAG